MQRKRITQFCDIFCFYNSFVKLREYVFDAVQLPTSSAWYFVPQSLSRIGLVWRSDSILTIWDVPCNLTGGKNPARFPREGLLLLSSYGAGRSRPGAQGTGAWRGALSGAPRRTCRRETRGPREGLGGSRGLVQWARAWGSEAGVQVASRISTC